MDFPLYIFYQIYSLLVFDHLSFTNAGGGVQYHKYIVVVVFTLQV